MSPDFEVLLYARDQIYGFLRQLLDDKEFRKGRADAIEKIVKDFYERFRPEEMRLRNEKTGSELGVPIYPSDSKPPHNYICTLKEFVEFPDFKISHTLIFVKKLPEEKYKRADFALELAWLPSFTRPEKDFIKKTMPRSVRNMLRPHTMNRIILSPKTSKEDILAQLIIFSSIRGLFQNIEESFNFFKHYFSRFRGISKLRGNAREEITREAFNHLVKNCSRPMEELSFKSYVTTILQGIIKSRNRDSLSHPFNIDSFDAIEKGKELKRSKNLGEEELYDPEIAPRYDNYLRFEINGEELFGVDRVAKETHTSRDTIYRYIRLGKIKARKVPIDQGECLALTQSDIELLKRALSPMKKRVALIKMIAQKDDISKEGARKKVYRLEKKGRSLDEIYSMYRN